MEKNFRSDGEKSETYINNNISASEYYLHSVLESGFFLLQIAIIYRVTCEPRLILGFNRLEYM